MSEAGAEKALDELRKLPENKQCANCGVVAQHGHGAVVMTFATFVCHTCKSSHQSFSHLCKSVSMSYWTHKEVKKLRDGGNARCRSVFMGKMDESQGLRPGASLQATKDFVDRVYNKRAYFESRPAASFAMKGATEDVLQDAINILLVDCQSQKQGAHHKECKQQTTNYITTFVPVFHCQGVSSGSEVGLAPEWHGDEGTGAEEADFQGNAIDGARLL